MKKIVVLVILFSCFCLNLYGAILTTERNTLIDLYNSTDGDDGDGWTNITPGKEWKENGDFKVSGTECDWEGITCNSEKTHVTKIILSNKNLDGYIPDFSELNNLTIMFIEGNSLLTGNIPDFSGLSELTSVTLSSNNLNGSIPDLSELPKLTNLNLFNNNLDGVIPDFSLPALTDLRLGCNKLNGIIPDFSGMPELEL